MMGHTITIGGLLLSLGIIGGLLAIAFGLLDAFANGMADAAGDNGKSGCIIFAVGLVVLVGSILGLVL